MCLYDGVLRYVSLAHRLVPIIIAQHMRGRRRRQHLAVETLSTSSEAVAAVAQAYAWFTGHTVPAHVARAKANPTDAGNSPCNAGAGAASSDGGGAGAGATPGAGAGAGSGDGATTAGAQPSAGAASALAASADLPVAPGGGTATRERFEHDSKMFALLLAMPLAAVIGIEAPANMEPQAYAQATVQLLSKILAVASFALDMPGSDGVQRQLSRCLAECTLRYRCLQVLEPGTTLRGVLADFAKVRGFDRMLQGLRVAHSKMSRSADVCTAFSVIKSLEHVPLSADEFKEVSVRLFRAMRDVALSLTDVELKVESDYTAWLLQKIMALIEPVMRLTMGFAEVSEYIFAVRLDMASRGLHSKFMNQRLTAIKDLINMCNYIDKYADEMAARAPENQSWLSHSVIATYVRRNGWLEELFGSRLHQEVCTAATCVFGEAAAQSPDLNVSCR